MENDAAEKALQPVAILDERVRELGREAIALAPNLLAAVIMLVVTWLVAMGLAALIARLLRKSGRRPSLVEAMRKVVKIFVWVVGILVAATLLFPSLTPSGLLAGLGIGSLAIGLAFKDIFENFLAGLLILLRKPMTIGDDIECEDVRGKVEHISMRDTFVRKRSGELVLVPNSYLFKNPLKILTDQELRRISIIVGVAYGEDVDRSRDVILNAVEGLETVADKPVQVFAREFNSSSIDFMVRWWTDATPIGEHRSRDKVVASVKRALDGAGIEIPFPYRTLTFKEPLPVETRSTGSSEGD